MEAENGDCVSRLGRHGSLSQNQIRINKVSHIVSNMAQNVKFSIRIQTVKNKSCVHKVKSTSHSPHPKDKKHRNPIDNENVEVSIHNDKGMQ